MAKKIFKTLLLTFAVIVVASLIPNAQAMAAIKANPTNSKVLVDGKNIAFEAYNINDENYFKLRDLAYVLSSSKKNFSVGYDAKNDAILLNSGEKYAAVGGELSKKQSGTKTASPIASLLSKDGKQYFLMSYKIDGYNYFKLRDIATIFNIGIGWDGAANTIAINTNEGYAMPVATGSKPYLNTYYLMSVGMSVGELNSRYGEGVVRSNYGIIEYPQGFSVAPIKGRDASFDDDAVCVSLNGKVSLLISNCPSTITLNQMKSIFGSATVAYNDYSDGYSVSVPYAGEVITMDSDIKGNVSASSRFNFNPVNRINQPTPIKPDTNYQGKWYEGQIGDHSYESNYTELVLRNISDSSLTFDLYMNRGIVSNVEGIKAFSTDGVVYTATFSEDSWGIDGCKVKITLQDGRVFLEGGTIDYFNGELYR